MHVLMTTDTLGGVFTYAAELCSWLTAHGVRVTLASMGRPARPDQRAAIERSGATFLESVYRLEWMDDPWQDVARAGEWLLEIEKWTNPDVIHLNGYAHGALAWRAPVCIVAHSCVLSWWRAVFGEAAPAQYQAYRHAVLQGLSAADAVVAPTRAMLDALRLEYGTLSKTAVIHNGVLQPGEAGVSKEAFVLCAGRVWDAAKNVTALAAAAPRVAWPIHVAGDSADVSADPGESVNNLSLLGLLPRLELEAWMRRASIFASPAKYEPFGLSILEAAARGCALVLGDIPSLRELWTDSALFVDPHDSSALAGALNQLCADPMLRSHFALRARTCARRYGLERMGTAYMSLYDSLADRARPFRSMEIQS